MLEKEMATYSSTLASRILWTEGPGGLLSMGQSRTRLKWLSMHALENEMATCSSIPARRIPGTEEPGWLPSTGSHRVGQKWLSSSSSRELCGWDGKEPACNEGDPWLIPGSGRSCGVRNGYPLQCSCLENSMDKGAWWVTVHRVAKSQTRLSN